MRLEQPLVNRLIPVFGPPGSGSGLEPAVAPNTPWRWWASEGTWVSDPVDVSWEAGATIPGFAAATAGNLGVIVGASGVSPSSVRGSALSIPFGNPVAAASWNGSSMDRHPSDYFGPTAVATTSGTGTAYLIWGLAPELQDPDTTYTGTDADTLPTETRTVEDILGTDFTVVEPAYAWSEDSVGNLGDWAIDMSSRTGDMWGPRDTSGWGNSPTFQLAGILTSPDGTHHRPVVADDGTLSTEASP